MKEIIKIQNFLESCDPRAIRFDNLDDAIIGVSHCGSLCYSYSKLLDIFTERDEMTLWEATEWIDYNVIGTMGGEGFVIVFDTLTL